MDWGTDIQRLHRLTKNAAASRCLMQTSNFIFVAQYNKALKLMLTTEQKQTFSVGKRMAPKAQIVPSWVQRLTLREVTLG